MKLIFDNFQIHKHREVEFGPHVTTIVGDSDTGKSTLLRGLRWIALNRPLGNDYIRHGQKWCRAEIQTDDKHKIVRKRGKENCYYVDGKKIVFDTVSRTKPPEEVNAILNLDETNFQRQLDLPFWFLKTGADLASELNAIVNLSLIDHALGFMAAKTRNLKSDAEYAESRLESTKTSAEALAWVRDADKALAAAEKAEEEAQAIGERVERLQSLLDSARGLQTRLKRPVPSLEQIALRQMEIDTLTEGQRRIDRLAYLLSEAQTLKDRICEAETEAERLSKTTLKGKCPSCGQSLK